MERACLVVHPPAWSWKLRHGLGTSAVLCPALASVPANSFTTLAFVSLVLLLSALHWLHCRLQDLRVSLSITHSCCSCFGARLTFSNSFATLAVVSLPCPLHWQLSSHGEPPCRLPGPLPEFPCLLPRRSLPSQSHNPLMHSHCKHHSDKFICCWWIVSVTLAIELKSLASDHVSSAPSPSSDQAQASCHLEPRSQPCNEAPLHIRGL